MKSYMGVILTPYGGGSWFRAKTPELAAKGVVRIFKSDWKSLMKLKGPTVKVPIYDVTDIDVTISDNGVREKDTDKWVTHTKVVEVKV